MGLGSSTMRSGMPSDSNSALNLYLWISFSFVKIELDNPHFSVNFSSGYLCM
jgi:hypothetical protein